MQNSGSFAFSPNHVAIYISVPYLPFSATCVILMTKPFQRYHNFYELVTFTVTFDLRLKKKNLKIGHNFLYDEIRLAYLASLFLTTKPFQCYHKF